MTVISTENQSALPLYGRVTVKAGGFGVDDIAIIFVCREKTNIPNQ